jgi:MFS family permease
MNALAKLRASAFRTARLIRRLVDERCRRGTMGCLGFDPARRLQAAAATPGSGRRIGRCEHQEQARSLVCGTSAAIHFVPVMIDSIETLPEKTLSRTARRLNLIAVTASMAVASLIYGMSMPLLALTLEDQGIDSTLIGLNAAAQSIAVLLVAPVASPIMRAYGPARLIVAATLASSLLFILLPAFQNVHAWFPLRFAMGVAAAILWIAAEAWVNQIAEEHNRGRVVAIYSMATAAGFALGPLMLTCVGSRGWLPFATAAGLTALAALPVLAVVRQAPSLEGRPSTGLLGYLFIAPVPMFICALFAAVDGIVLTFLPLYGHKLDVPEESTLLFVTLMGVGGIVGQVPIGWLADRLDRRLLAAACVVVLILGALTIPAALHSWPWVWLHFLLFGGVLGGIYTVGLILLGERFKSADLASASSTFGLMWGIGMIAGPPLGGLGMRLSEPHGLIVVIAFLLLAFLPLPIIAWVRQPRT